ncbi:hypothetical protein LWI28_009203 [Acer negundo]|uniref:Pentatricopeptide repeat-containing protein n=1 Tax=Acer negundo TaxID=4023 RepID=A0AAD5ITZ7_ACENE|nr:hypothetical protein LWI28_009203 [Acer negundo]
MISGYVENGKFFEAEELFDHMPHNSKNAIVITSMMTGYCKEGILNNARVLFEGIQCKDRASFNAMISGYAQNGVGEEALRLYSNMHKIGLQADDATLVLVFTASNVVAYIVESELAIRQICSPNLVSWNTVIAAFAQHGLYEKAFAQHGLYEKAFSFFNEMGFEPDGITFHSLLSACGHARKVFSRAGIQCFPAERWEKKRVNSVGRDYQQLSFDDDSVHEEPLWLSLVKGLKFVFTFLVKQLSQLKYLEWPSFQSTEMDPLTAQMVNFNKGMTSFTSRTSRITKSQVREAEGMRVQEEDIKDEMNRNLQVIQATYKKLLNGFMEASQDRFSKLEKAVNRIEGHLGRIEDKVLNREIVSLRDSLNLECARAILRSGRIVNNGRNEEIIDESNNAPRERNDEEKGILVR